MNTAASQSMVCKRLLVVGIGLIGGSLAKAVKDRGLAEEVIGSSRSTATVERAVELGIIDRGDVDIEALFGQLEAGDIVFLAAPTLSVPNLIRQSRDAVTRGVILTDGASVKGNIEKAVLETFGEYPPTVVLGHPIAGSEKHGVEAANPLLYENHRVILTPSPTTDAGAIAAVTALWQSVGATVNLMAVAEHDRVLAGTSHLPHVLAYALVDTLSHRPESQNIFRYAAGGFRDFTRIAGSDPTMWHDIVLANREAVIESIDELARHLDKIRGFIDTEDSDSLMQVFSDAKSTREHFLQLLESIKSDGT